MVATVGGESYAADAIFLATIALFLGALTKTVQAYVPVPYTVQLLLWGLAFGIGGQTFVKSWQYVEPGISAWKDVTPSFLTALFFPPLLFCGAFGLPRAVTLKASSHIALLGIIGVATGTGMTAVVARYVLPYSWTWVQALLFGAIVAATDPVAAIVLLKEVDAPEEIRVTVDGEALVDDGVAAVLFAVFRAFAHGNTLSPAAVVRLLCQQSLGGPAIGLAFALVGILWLRIAPPDANLAAAILLVAAYGSFFVADEILLASGILAVVMLGMAMAVLRRHSVKAAVEEPLNIIWEIVEYVANTLVFVVSGILIAGKIYDMHQDASPWKIPSAAYAYAVVLWLLLLVIRVVNILLFWPLLARSGYGIDLATAAITAWSGLRGVVGLALALYVQLDANIRGPAYREQAFFFMSTTLVLTVVVQGGLYKPFLKVVGFGSQGSRQAVCSAGLPMQRDSPTDPPEPSLPQLELPSHQQPSPGNALQQATTELEKISAQK